MTAPGFRLIGDAPDPGAASAAMVIVCDLSGRLLLQLRDDRAGIAAPGHWGLFGGGVETGETLEQAACRELEEETGLRIGASALSAFAWVQSRSALRTRLYVFRTRLDIGPADIRLGEGAGFAFMLPAQVREARLVPVLTPVIEAFLSAPR